MMRRFKFVRRGSRRGADRVLDAIRADVLKVLKASVPRVKDQELILRIRMVAGMVNWLVLAPVGTELRDNSTKQLARLVVPVIAGAFRGTSSP